jgi:hypothetical protein
MTAQPPALYFQLDRATETYNGPANMRVLVPRGYEAEAERLVQRYQTEVIEAQRQGEERWKNPPEPH